ncbi:MAG: DinB family protein [Chitinophagales bacterium]|nr:DinB family protein [Chitinophagales bacterium]
MQNKEIQTLIDTVEFSQGLALWYLSFLKEQNPLKVFEMEGVKLNTLHWVVGHIAWAEQDLILYGTHGKKSDIAFLDDFAISKSGNENTSIPFLDLIKAMKEVHELSIEHLKTFTDADLEKENAYKLSFGMPPTYKTIIMHHIRHLGVHAGHLGWLCKLYGVKTV